MAMTVAAIVLAAGGSQRLGQPKQLLVHKSETLIARALRLAAEAGASPVFAVLGAESDIIRRAIGKSEAIVVENADWQRGIATSIHEGIRALEDHSPGAHGVLLLGCDQPRLEANHLRALIGAFDAQGEVIAASAYADIQGIPAVFPRTAFAGLLALRGDRGARALIVDAPCAVVAVPFEGGEIDIDLPQDLAQIG
jgi:CTP:molybdopterin cytidylyltransferase MocA